MLPRYAILRYAAAMLSPPCLLPDAGDAAAFAAVTAKILRYATMRYDICHAAI